MRSFFENIVYWITDTLCDEKGDPSSTRQAGFIVLIATIVLAFMGAETHIIYAMAGLTTTLFTGAQVAKKYNKRSSEEVGDETS